VCDDEVVAEVNKCLQIQIKTVKRDDSALVPRWHKAVEVAGDYLQKIGCVTHSSSYPIGMFDVLHNELLAEK
jgi:hypothetical protein